MSKEKVLAEEGNKEMDDNLSWDDDLLYDESGISKTEMTLEELQEILGLTVKQDNINKLINYLCFLSAYTNDGQINISYRAPSSTGKSYIPLEMAELFPKKDLKIIGYASPTSFFHDGVWNEEKKIIEMDLERKIVVFVDQPHDKLLQRLRPLLSHDQKEIVCKITDRKEKYGIRTKSVVIRGFPAVAFCTGSLKLDEQEATRNFLLSPETTQEKIREAVVLKFTKEGNKGKYKDELQRNIKRRLLRIRIKAIANENINDVIIPENKVRKITERYLENHKRLKPRDMRDAGRLMSIIKTLAIHNLWYRERDDDNNIIANDQDIEDAFKIWKILGVTQELGIPPYVFRVFQEVILPIYDEVGVTRTDIMKKHFEVYGRPVSSKFLRTEILPPLESVGLISQEPDPSDKRRMLVFVPTPHSKGLYYSQDNIVQQCGVEQNNIVPRTVGYAESIVEECGVKETEEKESFPDANFPKNKKKRSKNG